MQAYVNGSTFAGKTYRDAEAAHVGSRKSEKILSTHQKVNMVAFVATKLADPASDGSMCTFKDLECLKAYFNACPLVLHKDSVNLSHTRRNVRRIQ